MTKGCAKAADCSAVNDPVNGTCKDCAVATPSCTTCCSTSFCNYNYQYLYLSKRITIWNKVVSLSAKQMLKMRLTIFTLVMLTAVSRVYFLPDKYIRV
jgi:hypothetical protein